MSQSQGLLWTIQDCVREETSDVVLFSQGNGTLSETIATGTTSSTTVVEKRKGGWPKGKKRRKESTDAQPPKTPVTGYVLFLTERRPFYKSNHPELSFSETTKILGNEWTNLPQCEKQKYLDEADADKDRYREELRIYRQSTTYLNAMRAKRKDVDERCDDETDGIDESFDDFHLIKDDLPDDLFCHVCDVHFTNQHNKNEHLYGKQHLLAITDEARKRVSKNGVEFTLASNVPQVVHDIFEMNFDRETEISTLRKHLGVQKSRKVTLVEEIRELQELESSLRNCLEQLCSKKVDIDEQLENLRMVPTLFGVINFQR